jgi:putative hydrolase of HD superfamily
MPFILNTNTKGKSWTEAGIKESQVRGMLENAIKRASVEMGEVFDVLLQKSLNLGYLAKG